MINSFSLKEIEEFRKFLVSPFFTKGRNYLPYLDDVMASNDSSLKTMDAKKSVKKGLVKNFSQQTLRNRYSELYKLGEEFLVYKALSESRLDKDKFLLQKLLDKRLDISFKIKYRETINFIKSNKFDISVYRDLTEIKEIYYKYLIRNNMVEKTYSEFYDNSKTLLCLNLLTLFDIGMEFKQQEFDNRKYDPNYITDYLKKINVSEMMEEFGNSDVDLYRVTAMCYNLYKAFENEKEEKYYFESHKIFKTITPNLKDSFKVSVFIAMINYCIGKLNEGDLNYKYELFKLYNEKLDQNLVSDLINNAYIFNHFRDYVHIGLAIKKYKWVEEFILKYSVLLPYEIREAETKLSYARLYFEKNNYRRSLEFLRDLKPSHYLMYLDSSLFKICSLFELNEYDEVFMEIDKLEHFLRNHKEIPNLHRINNANFLKVVKKLVRLKTDLKKADPGILEMELNKYKFISRKQWLQEKITQINQFNT